MHPDKEFCAICDGVGVLGCNFQSGPLCKAGRKAGPQCIDFDTRAKSAGYIKLEPGQVVVDEPPFTDEEADYLLEAIEPMKCNDCNEPCGTKARGMCLYLNIRAKLTEIKEARDE